MTASARCISCPLISEEGGFPNAYPVFGLLSQPRDRLESMYLAGRRSPRAYLPIVRVGHVRR